MRDGLTVIKAVIAHRKHAGLPLNLLEGMPTEMVSMEEAKAVKMFEELLDSAALAETLETSQSGEYSAQGQLERNASLLAPSESSCTAAATGQAYRALKELVVEQCNDPKLMQCGLEQCVASDGSVEWVATQSKERFKSEGAKCLVWNQHSLWLTSVPQGPQGWDFFLSHTQRDGHATTIASELFSEFRTLGKRCWLDVKMPKMDMEAMQDGVKGSKCVLAIITGGDENNHRYFQRPMCVQELKWAIEAGKPIVPVVAAADKPKVGDYIAEGKAKGIDLSACDFQHVDRSNSVMMSASLTCIIRAEAIAEADKAKLC
jgi:hypothetical protein